MTLNIAVNLKYGKNINEEEWNWQQWLRVNYSSFDDALCLNVLAGSCEVDSVSRSSCLQAWRPSLNPQYSLKQLGMIVCLLPQKWIDRERQTLGAFWLFCLAQITSLQFSERPYLKEIKQKLMRKAANVGFHIHTNMHVTHAHHHHKNKKKIF